MLGNRSLGVIRDALLNIRKTGLAFDERDWEPEEDLATQEAIFHGKTMGCFYIESPAMRLLQQKTNVGDFEHLVIHSRIIRPAANEFFLWQLEIPDCFLQQIHNYYQGQRV